MPHAATVGEALRELRLARGISALALGRARGVSRQQIANYESGKHKVGFFRMVQIAQCLNYSAVELLEYLDAIGARNGRRRHTPNRHRVAASLAEMCGALELGFHDRKLRRVIDELLEFD